MKIINSIEKFKLFRKTHEGLGFVPTMGALHRGHAALIKESIKENEITVVSIFVNPTQFNDPKDFESYPNTWEKDLLLCKNLGVDVIFSPGSNDMYFKKESIVLSEKVISESFEGEYRSGHFNGVLKVLLKLLNIVKPSNIYMGEKDYQQALLTQRLCIDFFIDTQVRIVKTVRDESGLPYSSRNLKLSDAGLLKAKFIAEKFHSSQSKEDFLKNLEIELDYFGKLDQKILMAHRVEGIRILDNKDAF